MELLLPTLSLFLFLFIYLTLNKATPTYELFFLIAYFGGFTSLGGYNISYFFLALSIVFSFLMKRTTIDKSDLVILLIFSFSIIAVSILSVNQAATPLGAIAKGIKTIVIFLPLFLLPKKNDFKLRISVIAFIFVSVVLGPVNMIFVGFDYGVASIPRFSGFFNDANYFALTCLLFYIAIRVQVSPSENRYIKKLLIFLIVLSQSFTVNTLLILYLLFGTSFKENKKTLLPFIFCFGYYLIFILLYNNFNFVLFDDYETNSISYKLNSIIFRLNAQFLGMAMMIADPSIFITGYGSGFSVQLFGKVMHNAYMQMLFDNGIFFSVIVILIVSFFVKKFDPPKFVLLVVLFCSVLFDTIYMLVFTFSLLYFFKSDSHEIQRK
ncbi:hypothetical protein [Vibrio crassostreae]|uniref:hypothetical protein n=1 Tax=Vibrio crassostreae TaxID=246167 RepID=UPI000F49B105|nr:hypothetical protein [Vibrio crassostreae]ROO48932.1 hypothetical protein EDB56_11516 [Vibrio crassostreae]ROO49196.1 hypothetical protein EDB58_11816 [Vibrio crassostreae]ROO66450.1 hypothetical protein EDB57_3999 [Vibrio crassostreae]ROO68298.1 hypothetical protein EDB53_4134 [Vibrio crassostreae]ROR62410.1 hypothetical protein EDB59_3690 [Vibrio crassostreae]